MQETKKITRGKIILVAFIVLAVLIIFICFKIISSNSKEKYTSFEDELVAAAENYYIINDIEVQDGEEKKITIKKLSNMNLIYNELKDECSGYVIIASERDISTDEYEIVYRAYIKCGNKYVTTNYSEY